MIEEQYIFSGRFEGYYFNHQTVAINEGDEIKDANALKVHLYRGELTNAQELSSFEPEKYVDRSSLLLHNVTKILVIPDITNAWAEPRIFDFDQVVIKNARVTAEDVISGKSYGIIEGDFVGITKKPFKPEEKEKLPYEDENGRYGQSLTNDGCGNSLNTGCSSIGVNTPVMGTSTVPQGGCSSYGTGCMPAAGCGSLFGGCSGNIWRLLSSLFLLLLLLAFLRNCKSCEVSDLIPNWETEESKRDQDQRTINEITRTMYFKGNSSELKVGSQQPVRDLAAFLKKNPNVKIVIHGHVNGDPSATGTVKDGYLNLSRKRAEKIKYLLREEGIDEERLFLKWHGAENMIHNKNSKENLQAKNRRVEIEIL